jgi:hypothetical protein
MCVRDNVSRASKFQNALPTKKTDWKENTKSPGDTPSELDPITSSVRTAQ